jgi:hypothetical protein
MMVQILSVTFGAWTILTPFVIELLTWLIEQTSEAVVFRLVWGTTWAFGVATLVLAGFELGWWVPPTILVPSVAGAALQIRYGSPVDWLLAKLLFRAE